MPVDQEQLSAAASRLYGLVPADFVAARGREAADAKAAGDPDLAAAVAGLRRPTVAAWAINLTAREPGALDDLVDVGTALRAAQTRLDTAALRELRARRTQVVARTTQTAVDLVAEADPGSTVSAAVREQIETTLTAALADPGAQDAVTSGRLVTALSYAGFGEVEIDTALAVPLRAVPTPAAEPEPSTPPTTPTIDPAAIRAAEHALEQAQQRLEVAETAMAQARSRRAEARRAVDAARAELVRVEEGEA